MFYYVMDNSFEDFFEKKNTFNMYIKWWTILKHLSIMNIWARDPGLTESGIHTNQTRFTNSINKSNTNSCSQISRQILLWNKYHFCTQNPSYCYVFCLFYSVSRDLKRITTEYKSWTFALNYYINLSWTVYYF